MKPITTTLARVAALGAGLALCAGAAFSQDKGSYLLRPGEWGDGVGSYLLPGDLRDAELSQWPLDGWYRVTHREGALKVSAVPQVRPVLPAFLQEIAVQGRPGVAKPTARPEAMAEAIDTQYIRVPGIKLVEGMQPSVKFSKGVLRPRLDHDYQLVLGETAFTLRVQNGLRNKDGKPFGEGALYTIGYGGESYSYLLGEQGWDSVLQAVSDIDGDGKPDFLIQVNGHHGAAEFLLLSRQARPGRNAPSAALAWQGC